jgi:hypothetical protein
MIRRTRRVHIALAAVAISATAFAPAALAGKGHGGGGTTGGSGSTVTGPVMVVDRNGDGLPNWNDEVTFNVSTTATDKPYVLLNCYQSGTWVSTGTGGFFASSPWPPNFTLSSAGWTSGAGDCTATLYMVGSNGRTQNLASMSFHVDA